MKQTTPLSKRLKRNSQTEVVNRIKKYGIPQRMTFLNYVLENEPISEKSAKVLNKFPRELQAIETGRSKKGNTVTNAVKTYYSMK